MESTFCQNLERLRNVKGLRSFLLPEDEGGAERVLLAFILDGYAEELRHRLGLRVVYRDDLSRLSTIKDIVRSVGTMFDYMALEIPDGEAMLSPEVVPLFNFLRDASLDLSHTVREVESHHPSLTSFFEVDRRLYAASLLNQGPLANGQHERA